MSEAAGRVIRGWREGGLTTLPTAGGAGGTHYTSRGEVVSLPFQLQEVQEVLTTLVEGRRPHYPSNCRRCRRYSLHY